MTTREYMPDGNNRERNKYAQQISNEAPEKAERQCVRLRLTLDKRERRNP
jgi:hypothetical protein